MKSIYFAGGCFWGVQHFFSLVQGVSKAVCGYANGNTGRPSYEQVYTDTTGFTETVKVTYRPEQISLEELCGLFFSIIDPLSVNRQGHDEGTRYRTGIFWADEADAPVVRKACAQLSEKLGQPLAVEQEPLRNFYEAEERHQDYLDKNPEGYCHLSLKTFRYLKIWQTIRLFLADEPDTIARMANCSAILAQMMPQFLWTGFYRVAGQQLVLGPFAGPEACMRIGYGKGVCGSAWKQGRTIIVPDVEQFPGHIACSSRSRSEIVVPVRKADGSISGVLDIDSESLDAFDSTDALWLEKIAALMEIC